MHPEDEVTLMMCHGDAPKRRNNIDDVSLALVVYSGQSGPCPTVNQLRLMLLTKGLVHLMLLRRFKV